MAPHCIANLLAGFGVVGCAQTTSTGIASPADVVARDQRIIIWGTTSSDVEHDTTGVQLAAGPRIRSVVTYCARYIHAPKPTWFRVFLGKGRAYGLGHRNPAGLAGALEQLGLGGETAEGALQASLTLANLLLFPCNESTIGDRQSRESDSLESACGAVVHREPADLRWWPGLGWVVRAVVRCTGSAASSKPFRVSAAFDMRGRLEVLAFGEQLW